MKRLLFRGVGTAIVTPFSNTGVDFHALGDLIEFQIAEGADALIICGTTGESPTLSEEERRKCISFAVEKCAGRIPVIAGCGSNSTACALALSRYACDAGADGILLVSPYYNKSSPAGMIAHYTAIADGVDRPVLLYNVPGRTGMDLPLSVYGELAKHENIVGVKEACGDVGKSARILRSCPADFSLYSGDDILTLPLLSLGAQGVISVVSNLVPRAMHELCHAYFAGDLAQARALHMHLLPLMDAMFSEVNPIPVKASMAMAGLAPGRVRLPLVGASNATKEQLKELLPRYL